ncbi:MAG: hypothetical protein GY737_13980 [Desulfobacteraceae bacterium]|nr:hypothetical protein [Desulfobacteraceae bacterium]
MSMRVLLELEKGVDGLEIAKRTECISIKVPAALKDGVRSLPPEDQMRLRKWLMYVMAMTVQTAAPEWKKIENLLS